MSGIDALGRFAAEAIDLLETEGRQEVAEALGELASRAHGVLQDLGLSSGELDHFVDMGTKVGATGGKLSGAGGGGAFYLIMRDWQSALRAAEQLKERAENKAIPHTIKAVGYQGSVPGLQANEPDRLSKTPVRRRESLTTLQIFA
jgi:mevalonate kinase